MQDSSENQSTGELIKGNSLIVKTLHKNVKTAG